jgi:alkanesulfonate monooxygenase SsuD/methylene tetrahydromethanopterin reductase-like flavin-dependent oxidoreductase (luciferase family)
MSRKQIHLGTSWERGTGVESVIQLARTAQRGLFDFIVGDPGSVALLAALAAVTDRLGLVGVVDPAGDEPFEVARRFATLDHLSDGRSGWLVSGSSVGRAPEFIAVVRACWDSWEPGAVLADEHTGVYVDPARLHTVGQLGVANLPTRLSGPPVLLSPKRFPLASCTVDDMPRAVEHTGHHQFVGTAEQIAAEMDSAVQSGACDGFILVAPATPHGLDAFVDSVVPVLQDRGVFRTAYDGTTLREHLRS